MRYIFLIIVFISTIAQGQNDLPTGSDQFMKTHFRNVDIAIDMLSYDHVAWVSSDSIQTLSEDELKTYGGQWFCYLDSVGIYHALCGAFDSTYTLTAHYLVDSATFAVNRSYELFDTTLAVQYSKAYSLALARKKTFLGTDDRLSYNHFIFRTDSTIRVHFVPAFQPNGYMVYGAEQHYTLNLDATKIIDTLEYFNEYRGYQATPSQEITIGFEDLDYIPIGAVFYSMYYEQYFKSIRILTKDYASSFIRGKDNEGSWFHVTKSPERKKKKKRKGNR